MHVLHAPSKMVIKIPSYLCSPIFTNCAKIKTSSLRNKLNLDLKRCHTIWMKISKHLGQINPKLWFGNMEEILQCRIYTTNPIKVSSVHRVTFEWSSTVTRHTVGLVVYGVTFLHTGLLSVCQQWS